MVNDYFIPTYCILPKKCVVKEISISKRWIRNLHEDTDFCYKVLEAGYKLWFCENTLIYHKPTRGHKFSIGVSENGALVGGAICGRPVARRLDDGYTLEVNRLCTNGTPNACSILYAAAYRAARAMGYNKVVTYILDTENGSSLKAAGYICVLQRKDRKSIAITPCTAEHPMSFKVPDRLLTDGQCRMMINGIQFIQALLEANELAVGKDHQFKGRYEAEKNAVIISLEKDEREW